MLKGQQLKARDVAQLAYMAGWRDKQLIIAVAVAHAESDYYVAADNLDANGKPTNPDGSVDYGLWQINSVHIGEKVGTQLVTASALVSSGQFNAAVAHDLVYKDRSYTFNAWSSYTNGAYKQYLAGAIEGVGNMWRVQFGIPLS